VASAEHKRSAAATGDDARLCQRMAAGDAAALRALYARYGGYAMAVALRILRVDAEAEEVVQETFVELWRRAREYDAGRGEARSWILAIARSRSLDRLRARGSAQRVKDQLAGQPPGPGAPSPLEDTEQRRRRERIQAALAQLPVEQRDTIELAYFEGLSHSEIAARTATPIGTVKSRIHLGLAKLSSLLGGGL
jgi:RNA polymerase sigma-70 factor (ECF subfamily)